MKPPPPILRPVLHKLVLPGLPVTFGAPLPADAYEHLREIVLSIPAVAYFLSPIDLGAFAHPGVIYGYAEHINPIHIRFRPVSSLLRCHAARDPWYESESLLAPADEVLILHARDEQTRELAGTFIDRVGALLDFDTLYPWRQLTGLYGIERETLQDALARNFLLYEHHTAAHGPQYRLNNHLRALS